MMLTERDFGRRLLVGGQWAETGRWITVEANGRGEIPVAEAGRDELEAAVGAAVEALADPMPAWERAAVLDRAAEALAAERGQLAGLICAEVAKPISLARAEVDRAVSTMRFSAAEARTLAGDAVTMDAAPAGVGKLAFSQRVPLGVVGAITPFNFPLNLAAHRLGPALAGGCPVVLKPATRAALTALELARILTEAGLPAGWLSVLPGPSSEIGQGLVDHPDVPVITFTGSVGVGWEIAARAPRKKVLLELGGSAPAVVAADADLDLAATRLSTNAFSYAGQSCVSVQRVYVADEIADDFIDRLLPQVTAVGLGDLEDGVTVCGPVIDQQAAQRLEAWIAEAQGQGAEVLAGGEAEGRWISPTVLAGVPHEARLIQEEAFGPVVSVNRFETLE